MQDVQSFNGGVVGGRLLLKRLNLQPQQEQINNSINNYQFQHQPQPQPQPQQAVLKCPRCDSLNTKFCYYNNYNLSQPRHFCKNCRRYWTKGGVLRNSSRSSSESSSTPPPAVGGVGLFQIPEVENFGVSSDLEPLVDSTANDIFSGDIGGFMSLITNNSNNTENANNSNNSVVVDEGNAAATASFTEFLQNQQAVQEWDMEKICGGHHEEDKIARSVDLVVDPTVGIEDLLQNRGSNVGFTTLDWHLTVGDNSDDNNNQGLYDVPDSSTVDHQAYWSHSTTAVHHHDDHQWSDSTSSHLPLFLP
ncbi:hypothetical protein SOVF_173070 [Spinacia oleracea]|nr:hypothetical protein SOVF_173070 [Spinacia oleracea]